jgi:hypothetical protein
MLLSQKTENLDLKSAASTVFIVATSGVVIVRKS